MSDPIGEHDGLNIYDQTPDEFAVRRRLERDGVTAELLYCLNKQVSYARRQYWIREMCYKRGDGNYQIVRGNRRGRVVIASYSYFPEDSKQHVILGPVAALSGRTWG